jgi:hypothetical protein
MDIISVEHCHPRQTPFLLLSVPSDVHDHPAKTSLLPILNTSAGNHGLRSVEVITCVPDVSVVQICKDISFFSRKISYALIRRPHEAVIIVHYFHDELNTQHVFLKKIGTEKLAPPNAFVHDELNTQHVFLKKLGKKQKGEKKQIMFRRPLCSALPV